VARNCWPGDRDSALLNGCYRETQLAALGRTESSGFGYNRPRAAVRSACVALMAKRLTPCLRQWDDDVE
ncbi:hypothetical protein, partial [Pollutimonas harenae]|uniref:hypothetical protein n=1 Tax=Pollutimonas harenae TaxID=657015 RepID=UPI001ADB3886